MSQAAITVPMVDTADWFDPTRLDRDDTLVRSEPFPFFVARQHLPAESEAAIDADFPNYPGAGYLPYEQNECGDTVNAIVDYMTSAAFADAVGAKLGIENLASYPTMVSISKKLNRRHGTIHTDGRSKIATVLLYLNPQWSDTSEGCLRFLNRIDDIEDLVVPEIKPLFGTLVGFKRTENSFHGHLPFEGQRHVVQVAWVVSEAEKLRKQKRGGLSHSIKKMFGWLDRRVGSGRDKNASHM